MFQTTQKWRLMGSATLGASLALLPLKGALAQDVKLGAELGLTGPYAFAGVPSRDGILVAVDQINGANPGHKLAVRIEDTGSDKQQAISLIGQFAQSKALLVFGPSSSSEGVAIAPVANDKKIAILTTSATSGAITQAGPWAFKTPANPQTIIPTIAKYAVDKLGVKKIALIFARDNEGQIGEKDSAKAYFQSHGVKIADEESVLTSDTDFQALITKISAMNVDTVFMTLVAEQAANFIIQARQSGMDPSTHYLGTPTMGSDRFLAVGGGAVEGAAFVSDYFAGADTPGNKAFVSAFKKKYGHLPDNWAALGYTAVQVANAAIKKAGENPTRQSVRDALASIRDFPVVIGNGHFTFGKNRNPDFGALVVTVKNSKFVVADQ